MSFRDKEATYRQYASSEIYWLLENEQFALDDCDLFLCCDQLLQRNLVIRFVKIPFEDLIRKLPKDILRFIDQFDAQFSPASVHVVLRLLEAQGRNINTWYFLDKNGAQHGPVDRFRIEQEIKDHPDSQRLIWRQGWEQWRRESELEYLRKLEYYDQEEPLQATLSSHNLNKDGRAQALDNTSLLPVAAGVMTLVSFPFWVINSLALPISSVGSITGWFLPLIFGLFMMASVIPVGIGLIRKRLWARSIKMTSSILFILWFIPHALLEGSGFWWIALVLYEFIILTLVVVSRDDFKTLQYEKQHPA
jgi:hypothetical protein